jgi:hypothetical protein
MIEDSQVIATYPNEGVAKYPIGRNKSDGAEMAFENDTEASLKDLWRSITQFQNAHIN